MAAPIYRFRNERQNITDSTPTEIYGVTAPFMFPGVTKEEISAVILTIQISNKTITDETCSVYITNGSSNWYLVKDYEILAGNAFDPLVGNLSLTKDLTLIVEAGGSTDLDVVVSLIETANAISV